MILTEALHRAAEAAASPLDVVALRESLGPDGLDLEISETVEACMALVHAGVFERCPVPGQRATYRVTGAGSVDKATVLFEARRRSGLVGHDTTPDIAPDPQRRRFTGASERRRAAVLAAITERDGTADEIAKRLGEQYQNVVSSLVQLRNTDAVVKRPGRKPWTWTIPARLAGTEPVPPSGISAGTPVEAGTAPSRSPASNEGENQEVRTAIDTLATALDVFGQTCQEIARALRGSR